MEKENPQIKAYYIAEKKLITLMMKMDADVVVMTMPDIETYHIKRSYIRKDIEYIFVPHGIGSTSLTLRNHATDNYDTVFLIDKYQRKEEENISKINNLKDRKLFNFGYTLLDDMIANYNKTKEKSNEKTVLIAPSWQKDNIIDLCLDEILSKLKGHDYKVIVRPHPQHVRHMREKFEKLKDQYKNDKTVEIQTDFSSNNTVFNASLLISDWSGIAYEYAYTTKKPVLFINSPMKVMNPEYKKYESNPFDIWIRSEIGEELELNELKNIDKVVEKMFDDKDKYSKKITKLVNDSVYNLGTSGEEGAKYIIECIQEKVNERRKK